MTIIIKPNSKNTKLPMVLFESLFTALNVSGNDDGVDVVQNAVGEQTFDVWTGNGSFSSIVATTGSNFTADCLCIANHNLSSSGAHILIYTSPDGAVWTQIQNIATPSDDSDLMVIFPEDTALHWRVTVNAGPASVGIVRLGKRLVFPTGLLHGYTPTNFSDEIKVLDGVTMGGHFSGSSVVSSGGSTSVALGGMFREFVEGDMAPFISHYNRSKSFFWAGGPDHLPLDLAYCWRPSNSATLKPKYIAGDVVEVTRMKLRVFR